jgi:hypothetical protein
VPEQLPSLVSLWQERDERDDELLIATYTLGVDYRPCILDCLQRTTNPDGICDYHDIFGEPTRNVSC